MKTLLATLALAQASLASASEGFKLPNDAYSLVPLKGEIIDIRPICPANPGGVSCLAIGSRIKLKFVLPGCLDVLAPVHSKTVQSDGETHIFISAHAVTRKASFGALCIRANVQTVTLYSSDESEKPVLHFLGAEY